jgi:hypothetical protein
MISALNVCMFPDNAEKFALHVTVTRRPGHEALPYRNKFDVQKATLVTQESIYQSMQESEDWKRYALMEDEALRSSPEGKGRLGMSWLILSWSKQEVMQPTLMPIPSLNECRLMSQLGRIWMKDSDILVSANLSVIARKTLILVCQVDTIELMAKLDMGYITSCPHCKKGPESNHSHCISRASRPRMDISTSLA